MIILNRPQTDPYFNLAAEEYLVKNTAEPLFMLWQNTPSVVIGKHQNALKEVNLSFLQEKKIPVIRRISGGGTVFHDMGNLNYSFIDFGPRESLVNFKKYCQPILHVLQNMGIDAQLSGKSDLKINDLKFSGNASHVHKNTVLHHGTLLFSSDINNLENSIKAQVKSYTDKAVQSNRSRVSNIQSHLPSQISLEAFKQKITDHILNSFPNSSKRDFTDYEITEIQKLAEEKYKSPEWNFAYSPPYQYNGTIDRRNTRLTFDIKVRNGKIIEVDFGTNTDKTIEKLQSVLIGCSHEPIAIEELFDTNYDFFKSLNIDKTSFLKVFFG